MFHRSKKQTLPIHTTSLCSRSYNSRYLHRNSNTTTAACPVVRRNCRCRRCTPVSFFRFYSIVSSQQRIRLLLILPCASFAEAKRSSVKIYHSYLALVPHSVSTTSMWWFIHTTTLLPWNLGFLVTF